MKDITIRVYGIWIDEHARVLISDERIGQFEFTKFPGGGMEHGEGTHDTLHREWAEELNMPIQITRHFYTTDNCQWSAFKPDTQVISIYYRVEPQGNPGTKIHTEKQTFTYKGEREEYFRWVNLDDLTPNMMTFPIDKKIVTALLSNY
jgi:8-oxo-dGTP diphosphatase